MSNKKLYTVYKVLNKINNNVYIGGRGNNHSETEKKNTSERMKLNNPAFNMSEETKKKMSMSHTGKSSPMKGKFKVEGDGRFEGCSRKGETNPSANTYILNSPTGETHIVHLAKNLKIFCNDRNLDFYALELSLSKQTRLIDENYYKQYKCIKPELKLKRENTIGWRVTVARTKDYNDIDNK